MEASPEIRVPLNVIGTMKGLPEIVCVERLVCALAVCLRVRGRAD